MFVPEYLSRPSDPLCVAVWDDRGEDHQQAGGGPHVQGGDHPQGRLHARPSPLNTEPILQHRHPRNIPSLCVFGMFNIMSEIDSFHKLLFQVWVTLDLIWYCTKVCLEICDYLEVNLFTIPFNDPSSGSGSSHSSAGSPASNGSSASSGPVTRGRKKHSRN